MAQTKKTANTDILKNYCGMFRQQSALFINTIKENELNAPNGTNLQKFLSRCTINIVCGKETV